MAFYSYLSTKIIIAFITKSYQDLFGVRSYINAQRICYEYYFFHNDYFLISSTDESENSLNEKKNKIYRIKQFTAETFSISPCGE